METARKSKEATVRLGCRNYDGTNAILTGRLQPAGFQLEVFEENVEASLPRGGKSDVS